MTRGVSSEPIRNAIAHGAIASPLRNGEACRPSWTVNAKTNMNPPKPRKNGSPSAIPRRIDRSPSVVKVVVTAVM
jgi:hypothetical protein